MQQTMHGMMPILSVIKVGRDRPQLCARESRAFHLDPISPLSGKRVRRVPEYARSCSPRGALHICLTPVKLADRQPPLGGDISNRGLVDAPLIRWMIVRGHQALRAMSQP
jgi:hypothetical protein